MKKGAWKQVKIEALRAQTTIGHKGARRGGAEARRRGGTLTQRKKTKNATRLGCGGGFLYRPRYFLSQSQGDTWYNDSVPHVFNKKEFKPIGTDGRGPAK
jgi:hypothetical protein